MRDLDLLFPEGVSVQAGGETIRVMPLPFGRWKPVLAALEPALKSGIDLGDLAGLIGAHGDAVTHALCAALDKPADWLDALPLDEITALIGAVVEVNGDFFVRRVLPQVKPMAERLSQVLTGQSSLSA